MERSYQKWKSLDHQPLIINVAGPPRCGRKIVARLLAHRLQSFFPSLKIASLHMGHIFRVLAKRALLDGLTLENLQTDLWRTDEILDRIARDLTCDFEQSSARISIGNLNEDALEELDWDLDVDNIVSFIAHREPSRTTLRQVRQRIRSALENYADILVTSEAGQHPRAEINFYLFADIENRARLFGNALRRKSISFDPEAVLSSTYRRDQEEFEIAGISYVKPTEDPAGRLHRYPGQFTAIDANTTSEVEIVQKILPTVLASWDNFRQGRFLREKLLEAFVHDRAHSSVGRMSILMLKGGSLGGLAGEVHSKIIKRIARDGHFDYVLGSLTENRMEFVIRRWSRVLTWSRELVRRLEATASDPEPALRFARELCFRAENFDHIRMERAIEELMKGKHHHNGAHKMILKLRFFLDYVKKECQYVLLWRNSERDKILSSWEIDQDAVEQEIKKASAEKGLPYVSISEMDEQDFVKLVLVGDGDSNKARPGSLRHMVYRELIEGSLKTIVQERINEGLAEGDLFSILNAVHGPNGPMTNELPMELALLPLRDVHLFSAFARFNGS